MPRVSANDEQIVDIFKKVRTIAVVGASPNPQKDSHRVAKYLRDVGYDMIPVYPKEEEILGKKVYRSLPEIDKQIDMVVVFRKPDAVTAIAEAAITRGDVKVLWTQIGIVNNDAARMAKDAGLEVVQNRCAMVEHDRLLK